MLDHVDVDKAHTEDLIWGWKKTLQPDVTLQQWTHKIQFVFEEKYSQIVMARVGQSRAADFEHASSEEGSQT